jgi:hypothetical protein
MLPGKYLFHVAYAADLLFNAVCAGNPDQTFSARCYEGAVKKSYTRWILPYWIVNGGAYVLRWTIGRVLGYRFGVDMPLNHCEDAFCNASILKDNFHTYDD